MERSFIKESTEEERAANQSTAEALSALLAPQIGKRRGVGTGTLIGGLAVYASLLLHAPLLLFAFPAEDARKSVRIEIVQIPPKAADTLTLKQPKALSLKPPASISPPNPEANAPSSTQGRSSKKRGGWSFTPKMRPGLEERNRIWEAEQRKLEMRIQALVAWEKGQRSKLKSVSMASEQLADCGGLGPIALVRSSDERDLSHWTALVPELFADGIYFQGTTQVLRRSYEVGRRRGRVEIALPAGHLVVELDAPKDALVIIGRPEARCLVGVDFKHLGFPITYRRLPVRLVTADNHFAAAMVDVTLHADAHFTMHAVDGSKLPFDHGRLRHADELTRTFASMQGVASWFR